MRRAMGVAPAGAWPNQGAVTATLPYHDRHRRRVRLVDDFGEAFLLDLERPALLRQGDGLACDDGSWIGVQAAPEAVGDARASDATALARLAWHLGNRHVAVEFVEGALRFLDDGVLAAMLEGLGATVTRGLAPFNPEAGAYAGEPGHGAAHEHGGRRHGH